MFPGAHSEVFYNEAGEPLGWDDHYHDEPEWCDICGMDGHNSLNCDYDYDRDEEDHDDMEDMA